MSLTILGYIAIPLSIYYLFKDGNKLLYFAVFFAGCNAMSVFTFKSSTFSLQLSYFFMMIWFIFLMFQSLSKGKIDVGNYLPRSLIAFLFISIVSILVAFFVPEGMEIVSVDGGLGYTSGFSSKNITQLAYLVFCIISCSMIGRSIKKKNISKDRVINTYCLGVVFVCLVSLYQIIALKYSLPYDKFFRQDLHSLNWGQRISGPCLEASMLSCYLITGLPLILRRKWKKWAVYLSELLCLGVGLYSLSSSFLTGVLLWLLLELGYKIFKDGKIKITPKKMFIILIAVVSILLVFVILQNQIMNALNQLQAKLSGDNLSGQERSLFFITSMKVWLNYPLTGIGFGSSRSTDLFSTWMANVGITGMIAFIVYVSDMLRVKSSMNYLKIPFLMVWIVMMISVSEPYLLFIWVLSALIWNASESMTCD